MTDEVMDLMRKGSLESRVEEWRKLGYRVTVGESLWGKKRSREEDWEDPKRKTVSGIFRVYKTNK